MSDAVRQFSAVVVSFYTGPVLHDCLEALLNAPLCSQIVLVNNGNRENVLQQLQEREREYTKLVLLTGHGNIGFGRGCNFGAEHATADNLVFVNPDCVLDDCALGAFDEALASNPSALFGGALRNTDGSEQRGCRRGELTLWSALVSFSGMGKPGDDAGIWRDFNRNREPFPVETTPMPVVSGALMAITRKTFEDVGWFDSSYFLHVEDIDICKRMWISGGQVMFVPSATALHVGATSETSNWRVTFAKISSFHYYFWTHAKGFLERLAVVATMPFLAIAIILRSLLR